MYQQRGGIYDHDQMMAHEQFSKMRVMNKRSPMPDQACSDKPIVLFMDSLNADSVDEMMQALREYLELEFLEKKID